MAPTAREWLAQLATELGIEQLDEGDIADILELAGIAAHVSERQAAPLSCWLAASAGRSAEEALQVTRKVAARLESRGS